MLSATKMMKIGINPYALCGGRGKIDEKSHQHDTLCGGRGGTDENYDVRSQAAEAEMMKTPFCCCFQRMMKYE